MNIIIVGGGVVGHSLAEKLLKEDHHLALIESDSAICQNLADRLDAKVINGSGSSMQVLHDAGIEDADMVLAVTPNDEVNIVVCALAAQYGVGRRIARLRSTEFTGEKAQVNLTKLGVTAVIYPEKAMVDHIVQYVQTPHAVESANFEGGKVLLRGYRIRPNMALAGKTLKEIRELITPTVLFAAVVRDGLGMIPDGSTRIEGGDIVYALFPQEAVDDFLSLVGIERKKGRKIVVTGESYTMTELGRAFADSDNKIVFVSPNREVAERLAAEFSYIEVIHGDCTNSDLLRELHISHASFFIAASTEADYNIMSALLAKAEGANEVIVTSVESHHDRLFNSIGIDHVVNPRLTAAREILEIISRGQIGAAVELSNVDIEAVRYNVQPGSPIDGQKIKAVARKLKKGSIVGVIVRNDSMILPTGETEVQAGDHVIMVTKHKNITALDKLFKT